MLQSEGLRYRHRGVDPLVVSIVGDMDLLTTNDVADLLRVAPSTVKRWRNDGTGPRWTRLPGARRVLYKRSDVEKWFDLQSRSSRQRRAA